MNSLSPSGCLVNILCFATLAWGFLGPASARPQAPNTDQQTELASGDRKQNLPRRRWVFKRPDGTILFQANYTSGERRSAAKLFFPNGEVMATGRFKRGKIEGEWLFYKSDGTPMEAFSGIYSTVVEHWPHGEPRSRGLTLDGHAHGRWDFAWPDGSPWLTAWFEHGHPVGTWQHRHLDGTPDPGFFDDGFPGSSSVQNIPWLLLRDPLFDDTWDAVHIDRLNGIGAIGSGAFDAPETQALANLAKPLITDLVFQQTGVSLAATKPFRAATPRSVEHMPQLLLSMLTAKGYVDGEHRKSADIFDHQARQILHQSSWLVPSDGEADSKQANLHRNYCRLLSLWALTRGDEGWWDFQLALSTATPKQVRSIPMPAETRMGGAHSAYPDYAIRFRPAKDKLADHGRKVFHSIESGLEWLAQEQTDATHWPGGEPHGLGLTGLALLAFLGDGNTIFEGKYAGLVRRTALWLCQRQEASGRFTPLVETKAGIYEHAVVTFALAELQALAPTPELETVVRQAMDCLVAMRTPDSGWGYVDKQLKSVAKPDSSITGWAMQALIAGRHAGINTTVETDWDAAIVTGAAFLDSLTDPKSGRTGYHKRGSLSSRVTGVNDHYPPVDAEALTSTALFAKLRAKALFNIELAGTHTEAIEIGTRLLMRSLPLWNDDGERYGNFNSDIYYWFWGSLAMHRINTKQASQWRKVLVKCALSSQDKQTGKWAPFGPWANIAGGSAYSTAMLVLCLETPLRESLPE